MTTLEDETQVSANGKPIGSLTQVYERLAKATVPAGERRKVTRAENDEDLLEESMFALRKKLPSDTIEELEAMNEADLRQRISQCEHSALETSLAQKADTELSTLKQQVKDLAAPYVEARKNVRNIAAYAAMVLEKSGKA